MLVHTALNKTIRTTLDPYFTHLKYIYNLRTGALIWQTFSLLSTNVVYAIQCSKCRAIYVGETGATLKQRLYQHIYHIQRGRLQNYCTPISPCMTFLAFPSLAWRPI